MSYQPTMASYDDQLNQWSNFTLDPRGFYVSERRNADGTIEYRYDSPEQPAPAPSTPRTYTNSQRPPDGQSTYSQSPDAAIEGSSSSPNYTPYAASTATCHNPAVVTTSTRQFTYQQNANRASFDNEPSEEHDTFNLPTQSYPRSFPTAAAPCGDPNYPTNSMTDGLANLSLNPGRDRANSLYGFEEEVVDDLSTEPVGKLICREPNSGEYETLDARYRAVETKNLKRFWKVGRVFMMLWTEPARTVSPGVTRNGSHYSTTWLDGNVYTEIRRFVVISVNHGSTVCSPIHTYNKQATFKRNLPEVHQHAIIYTAKNAPKELVTLDLDGNRMSENLIIEPIQVIREQKDDEGDLGDYSRVNFSKIYTVENFVRVLNIGVVHPKSMDSLIHNAIVKPRETSPQPPRTHKKHSSSSHKEARKSGEKEKGGRAKGSDRRRS